MLRLSRLVTTVVFLTFFCLLYVYQQTRIYAFAYTGQKRLAEFQDSLDKNTLLRYNISKKVSLVNIGSQVYSGKNDFYMPPTYRLVQIPNSPASRQQLKQPAKENIFVRIFGVKREAQAQTINR